MYFKRSKLNYNVCFWVIFICLAFQFLFIFMNLQVWQNLCKFWQEQQTGVLPQSSIPLQRKCQTWLNEKSNQIFFQWASKMFSRLAKSLSVLTGTANMCCHNRLPLREKVSNLAKCINQIKSWAVSIKDVFKSSKISEIAKPKVIPFTESNKKYKRLVRKTQSWSWWPRYSNKNLLFLGKSCSCVLVFLQWTHLKWKHTYPT